MPPQAVDVSCGKRVRLEESQRVPPQSLLSVKLQAEATSLVLQCSFAESEYGDKDGVAVFTCASKMSVLRFLMVKPVGCSRQGTEQSQGSGF